MVSGYGLTQLRTSYQRIEVLQTHTIPSLKSISAALDNVAATRLAVYRYVVDGIDDASRQGMQREIADTCRQMRAHTRFIDTADSRQVCLRYNN